MERLLYSNTFVQSFFNSGWTCQKLLLLLLKLATYVANY